MMKRFLLFFCFLPLLRIINKIRVIFLWCWNTYWILEYFQLNFLVADLAILSYVTSFRHHAWFLCVLQNSMHTLLQGDAGFQWTTLTKKNHCFCIYRSSRSRFQKQLNPIKFGLKIIIIYYPSILIFIFCTFFVFIQSD